MNQAFLDFVRYSIHPEIEVPKKACSIDWNEFMAFCNRQGVMGIVFEGMDSSKLKIPSTIIFNWLGYVEQIKQQSKVVNERIKDLSHVFEEKGIRSCILKGQANGLMYPKSELRSPGDIDIWLDASDKEIISMIRKVCPNAHYSLHHIKFDIYKDVSVEVHYSPSHLNNWITDKKLQKYINSQKDRQFSNKVGFYGTDICVLTDEFNAVYQMLHLYGHFFSTRNNLKQLIDYYYLLKQGFDDKTKKAIVSRFAEFDLLNYAGGVMWVLQNILGMDTQYLLVEPKEKYGGLILSEMLTYGKQQKVSFIKGQISRLKNNLVLLRYFPTEVVVFPFYLLWHQIWKVNMGFNLK